jgi:hypothetical protein
MNDVQIVRGNSRLAAVKKTRSNVLNAARPLAPPDGQLVAKSGGFQFVLKWLEWKHGMTSRKHALNDAQERQEHDASPTKRSAGYVAQVEYPYPTRWKQSPRDPIVLV